MNTKTIAHEVTFSASPKEVIEALMDPMKHSKFTGLPAEIEEGLKDLAAGMGQEKKAA